MRLAVVLVVVAGVLSGLPEKKPHALRPTPLRVSRSHLRLPLPPVNTATHGRSEGVSRSRAHDQRVARPAGAAAHHDITMYCATGNRNAAGRWPRLGDVAVLDRTLRFGTQVLIAGHVYTVEDWIGSGSEYDIYGGCEQRALAFGRKHLPVTVLS